MICPNFVDTLPFYPYMLLEHPIPDLVLLCCYNYHLPLWRKMFQALSSNEEKFITKLCAAILSQT